MEEASSVGTGVVDSFTKRELHLDRDHVRVLNVGVFDGERYTQNTITATVMFVIGCFFVGFTMLYLYQWRRQSVLAVRQEALAI